MTPDYATPFLAAFSTLTSLAVALGIVAFFVAILLGTLALIRTPPGAGSRGVRK
jgi:hypothetical protein